MGRKIMRVPLGFDWPLNKTWKGYLTPDELFGEDCPDCERGHSWQYEKLHSLWYGYSPFDPAMTGSTLLTPDTPAVREFAERNVGRAPEHYGFGEIAIWREGKRLSDMWNQQWCHHLSQADVDALLEADRLWEFTRKVVPGKGWVDLENPVHPTAAQVNEWSLRGMGHDGINAHVVIKARCARYGTPILCATCEGHGNIEKYPGQREECENWKWIEPPEGEGWQLWETVTEGSPISPVFETPEKLARWMSSPAYSWGVSNGSDIGYEDALAFVKEGWAPTLVVTPGHGVESGEQFIGRSALDIAEIVDDGTPALESGERASELRE
jgi:hypothetical protein